MAGLFGRIFKQWFENAIVDKLADSQTMQRVAVGAVKGAREAQRLAEESVKDPAKVKDGVFALFEALKKEASKDLGGIIGAAAPAAAPAALEPPPCAFKGKSVKELKELMGKHGISSAGMMERSELVSALKGARVSSTGEKELR
jgi:hypothetical protein